MILKEDILSNTTEKDIMEYYWGEHLEENRPIYKNPMRHDVNGTCYFKWYGDKYIFVDRARGIESNFDCFKYVMWLYNCSFYEVLIRINEDMVLNAVSKTLNPVKGNKYSDVKKVKRQRVKFKIKIREWNDYDIKYWSQYHISIDNLSKIAYPVNSYKSNAGSYNFKLKYKYNPDDPCYVYFFKSKKVKLYQPYSEYNKWKSNSTEEDVFGYSQLPHFGDDLFIASGGKDMLCLWEMGYNAIAPLSESTKIPDHIIKNIKSRFKNIYYLYDNDNTGVIMSTKFSQQHNAYNIILPNTIGKYKDVADFCKGLGLEQTKEIIENERHSNVGQINPTSTTISRRT